MDLNRSSLYFYALSDGVSVFLLFLARQKTQILPVVFFLYSIIFLTVVMQYFPKLRKSIKLSSLLLWSKNCSLMCILKLL